MKKWAVLTEDNKIITTGKTIDKIIKKTKKMGITDLCLYDGGCPRCGYNPERQSAPIENPRKEFLEYLRYFNKGSRYVTIKDYCMSMDRFYDIWNALLKEDAETKRKQEQNNPT